jgi:hypothetical protein
MKKFGIRGKSSELALKVKKSTETYLKQVREVIPETETLQFFLDYDTFEKDFREMTDLRTFDTKE